MAIKLLSTNETMVCVSKYDSDTDNPTKWKIGILDQLQVGFLRDMMTSYQIDVGESDDETKKTVGNIPVNKVNFRAFQLCVKGWENLVDESGNEIAFKTTKVIIGNKKYDGVDPSIVSRIPIDIITEMAEKGMGANIVEEKEVKN